MTKNTSGTNLCLRSHSCLFKVNLRENENLFEYYWEGGRLYHGFKFQLTNWESKTGERCNDF